MKSTTIHNLEDSLLALLREKANREGTSINQTVKSILEQALGIKKTKEQPHRAEFESFCGIWKNDDLKEFEKSTKDFNNVDREDWQ